MNKNNLICVLGILIFLLGLLYGDSNGQTGFGFGLCIVGTIIGIVFLFKSCCEG